MPFHRSRQQMLYIQKERVFCQASSLQKNSAPMNECGIFSMILKKECRFSIYHNININFFAVSMLKS